MATRLTSIVVDAGDPAALARFWSQALGWAVTWDEPDEVVVESVDEGVWGDGDPPCLVFVPVPDDKADKNRVHLDLASTSPAHQREIVERLRGLGATPVDIGQVDVPWVVLADPEGNELCVLDAREEYNGIDGIAAVVIDCVDPLALAEFWEAATGWEAARSGRELVSFAHPSATTTRLELLAAPGEKSAKNRLHVDLAPWPDGDLAAEVARLERIGGRRVDVGQVDVSWVVLADPEGNELCVLTPR